MSFIENLIRSRAQEQQEPVINNRLDVSLREQEQNRVPPVGQIAASLSGRSRQPLSVPRTPAPSAVSVVGRPESNLFN